MVIYTIRIEPVFEFNAEQIEWIIEDAFKKRLGLHKPGVEIINID